MIAYALAHPMDGYRRLTWQMIDADIAYLSPRACPGTVTYFRLNTPATMAQVKVEFSGAGGASFAPALRVQTAIFRLP